MGDTFLGFTVLFTMYKHACLVEFLVEGLGVMFIVLLQLIPFGEMECGFRPIGSQQFLHLLSFILTFSSALEVL